MICSADSAEKEEADINACLTSTLKLLNNQIKYTCTVNTDFADLPPIGCFPGKLNQVFTNMIVNAVHAVGEDGVIDVRTRLLDHAVEVV